MDYKKAKALIRLGQSLEQKWGLGFETPETSDKWENAPTEDGYGEQEIKNKLT